MFENVLNALSVIDSWGGAHSISAEKCRLMLKRTEILVPAFRADMPDSVSDREVRDMAIRAALVE